MVFLQPSRPEVSNRFKNEPGHGSRVLESHRKRQGNLQCENVFIGGDEEDIGVL